MRIPRDFLFLLGGVLLLALDARGQTPAPAEPVTTPGLWPGEPATTNPAAAGVVIPASNVNAAQPGCWAKLYDAENFRGPNVTVVGPAQMPKLQGTFRSIEVGPSAVLVTFQDDDFADESSRFDAGARIASLRAAGTGPPFESLKVTCTAAAGQ